MDWTPYDIVDSSLSKDEKRSKKMKKQLSSMWEQASVINHLINIHQYMKDDSFYGENDIVELLKCKHVDKTKWPTVTKNILSTLSDKEQTINYYQMLFDKMVHQYVQYLINNGHIQSYSDVVTKSNLIDISKLFESDDDDVMSSPDIEFNEEDINTLRTYDWYSFVPCFTQLTIKLNKHRYIQIDTISINETQKTIEVKISDYIGTKKDWSCTGYTQVQLSFDNNQDDGLPCSTNIINTVSYEQLLTNHIDKMNWSNEEINFWLNMFDINYPEKMVLAEFDIDDEAEMHKRVLLLSMQDFIQLQKISNTVALHTQLLMENQEMVEFLHTCMNNRLIIEYLKYIAVINYELLTSSTIEQKTDSNNIDSRIIYKSKNAAEKLIMDIDTMKIKANEQPKNITAKGTKYYE